MATYHERNICKVMPGKTSMGVLQRNFPEYMTAGGAIDASKFPTAHHAATWACAQTKHLFPDTTEKEAKR